MSTHFPDPVQMLANFARTDPRYGGRAQEAYHSLSATLESPLEKVFLAGWCIAYAAAPSVTYAGQWFRAPSAEPALFDLDAQVSAGSYRVDFMVTLRPQNDSVRLVAVECDGHAWHDRTSLQASRDRARDRALLRLGIQTVRYTTTDICQRLPETLIDLHSTLKSLAGQVG